MLAWKWEVRMALSLAVSQAVILAETQAVILAETQDWTLAVILAETQDSTRHGLCAWRPRRICSGGEFVNQKTSRAPAGRRPRSDARDGLV